MRYAGYLRYGQMPFCHSSFQKEEERFCKLLNYEFYFISWSSKKRKWWVIITVTSFPSLTDILDYGARGNVAEYAIELKKGI